MSGTLLPWLIGVQVWRTEVRGIRGKERVWSPPKIMTAMSILRRSTYLLTAREGNVFRRVCLSVYRGGSLLEGSLQPGGFLSRWGSPSRGGYIEREIPGTEIYWGPLHQSVCSLLECILVVMIFDV